MVELFFRPDEITKQGGLIQWWLRDLHPIRQTKQSEKQCFESHPSDYSFCLANQFKGVPSINQVFWYLCSIEQKIVAQP